MVLNLSLNIMMSQTTTQATGLPAVKSLAGILLGLLLALAGIGCGGASETGGQEPQAAGDTAAGEQTAMDKETQGLALATFALG
jgi:hypothetical protein